MSDETYDNIRIGAYFDQIESVLSGDDLLYVKSLISSSIRYFESFVKVVPIDGTFYLPRLCYQWYPINNYQNCIQYYYQTCGVGMSFALYFQYSTLYTLSLHKAISMFLIFYFYCARKKCKH